MKYHILDTNKIKLNRGFGIKWLELEKWLNQFGRKYVDHIEVNGQIYIIAEVDDNDQQDSPDEE